MACVASMSKYATLLMHWPLTRHFSWITRSAAAADAVSTPFLFFSCFASILDARNTAKALTYSSANALDRWLLQSLLGYTYCLFLFLESVAHCRAESSMQYVFVLLLSWSCLFCFSITCMWFCSCLRQATTIGLHLNFCISLFWLPVSI